MSELKDRYREEIDAITQKLDLIAMSRSIDTTGQGVKVTTEAGNVKTLFFELIDQIESGKPSSSEKKQKIVTETKS